MQNMENNSLQNINELKFIQKIMEDNDVFNETKIEYKYFSDPLAKVLFSIQAEWITKMGEFKPLLHFKNLCEDEARITRFNNMNYPFKLTNNPQDIVDFLSRFEDNSIKYQTLERYITDNWIKRKMEETALGMLDKVNDSSVDIRNVLVNTSLKLDNLLYNSEDDVVCKNEEELVDDFIAYIRDPNVESYIKTGIDIIDKSSGGTPKESFIAIAACPKMGKLYVIFQIHIISAVLIRNN